MRILKSFCLLLGVYSLLYSEVEAQWLLGCYSENLTDGNLWKKPPYKQQQLTPFSCVQACSKLNYTYSALQNGTLCFCGGDHASLGQAMEGKCTVKCAGDNRLFCGGLNSSHVYSVAEPVISSLIIVNDAIVETNKSFVITARAQASPGNNINASGIDKGISVEWSFDGKVINTSFSDWKGKSSNATIAWLIQLPGRYKFCGKASNNYSKEENCSTVEVLDPVFGLEVVPASNDSQITNGSQVPVEKKIFVKVLLRGGSNVSFEFDFGERFGRNKEKRPLKVSGSEQYESSYLCARAWHRYQRCGTYSLTVTAFNDISMKSSYPRWFETVVDDFEVLKSSDLKTRSGNWHLKLGNHTDGQEFYVSLNKRPHGCNSSFSCIWSFDDGTPDESKTCYVGHQELTAQHSFRVNKTGKHRVELKVQGTVTHSKFVYVHTKLTGASLDWERCKDSGNRLCIKFRASITPKAETDLDIKYVWHLNGMNTTASKSELEKLYADVGRFSASVTADNWISSVTSQSKEVLVLWEVKRVELADIPRTQEGHVTNFTVTAEGSEITYSWDFGDGAVAANETTGRTSHVYKRAGKFTVTVTASNAVSNMSAVGFAYVSKRKPCATIKIYGAGVVEVSRSQEIFMEADVNITCPDVRVVRYRWKVQGMDETDVQLDGRVLVVPPRRLSCNSCPYMFEVKLFKADGTSSVQHNSSLKVSDSALVPIITNGSSGAFKSNMISNITLDASNSYDPDWPDNHSGLKFLWSCRTGYGASCFKTKANTPSWTRSVITFPAHWLNRTRAPFREFTLILMRDGRRNASARYRLKQDSTSEHQVVVTCLRCHGTVHPREGLLVTSECSTCPNKSDVTYTWKLLVNKNAGKRQCPKVTNETVTTPNTSSTTKTPKTNPCEQVAAARPTGSPSRANQGGKVGRGAMCLSDREFPAVNESVCKPNFGGGHGSSWTTAAPPFEVTAGSGSTSNGGLKDGATTAPPTRAEEWKRIGKSPLKGIAGPKDWTVLIPGSWDWEYRENKVTVDVKCGGVKCGSASLRFKAQYEGCCVGAYLWAPANGTELATEFKLFSLGRQPAKLDVYYKLDSSDKSGHYAYSGYKPSPSFRLPAGLEKNDYRVYLEVASRDVRGNASWACSVSIRVTPRTPAQGIAVNETLNKLEELKTLGDYQGTLQYITAVAMTLNRSDTVRGASVTPGPALKTYLLKALRKLTVQTEVFARPLSLALRSLTEDWSQLNAEQVTIAAGILSELVRDPRNSTTGYADLAERTRKWDRTDINEDLADIILGAASNLIAGVYSLEESSWAFGEELVLGFLKDAENIIKEKLVTRLVGQWPLQASLSAFSVLADKVREVNDSLRPLNGVQVNLSRHPDSGRNEAVFECFGRLLVVQERHPRARRSSSNLIHTKVTRLKLIRYTGKYRIIAEDLPKNLSDEIRESGVRISFPISAHKVLNMTENHTLSRGYTNVHSVERAQVVTSQTLQVTVKLQTPLPHGFLLKLLVGNGKSPTEVRFNSSTSFTSADMTWRLDSLQLSGGRKVYVGLRLEESYSRITQIRNVQPVRYLLDIRWVGCYHFDEQVGDWRDGDCSVEKLTDSHIHCKCNTLAAISGGVLPQRYNFTDTYSETIEGELFEYPVFVLVCVILLVYLVLLVWCVREDRLAAGKHGVIYINDNPLATYVQRYQIVIETGNCFNAGTTAGVNIVLHGEGGISDPIEMKREGGPRLFGRTAKDVFVVCISKDLKSVRKVHIWHNNEGDNPAWFLRRVVVKDLRTRDSRSFEADRWLAVDKADGRVDCVLLPGKTVAAPLGQTLLDHHLWLSVASRPSCSRFTRAQRLSCCLSLLLSFLCLNLIWFEPAGEEEPLLGALDLSWRTVWVGALSSLLALPVNLLWIFLFRCGEGGGNSRTGSKAFARALVKTVSGRGQNAGVMLEQSAKTLQYLQRLKRTQSSSDLSRRSYSSYSESSVYSTRRGIQPDFSSDSSSLGYKTGSDVSSSHRRSLEVAPQRPVASAGRMYLPHFCAHLAWIGCLLTAASAAYFAVWFGLRLGRDLSLRWLQSFCFALLESMLVSQPIMVLLLVLLVHLSRPRRVHPAGAVTQSSDVDDVLEDFSSEDPSSSVNHAFAKDELEAALEVRKRRRYLKYLKPLSKSKLNDARQKKLERNAKMEYAAEFVGLLVFLLATCILIARVNSPHASQLKQSLEISLLRPHVKAGTPYDWWKSHSAGLVDALYWESDSRAHASLNITPVSEERFKENGNHSSSRPTEHACFQPCSCCNTTWLERVLNKTRPEVVRQLNKLSAESWITPCTTELRVELAVLSLALGTLSTIVLSVQVPLAREPTVHMQVNTLQALDSSAVDKVVLVACKVVFILCYFYLLRRELLLVLKFSSRYLRCVWRLLEFSILVLSSWCLVSYIRWSVGLYSLIRRIRDEKLNAVYDAANLAYGGQEMLRCAYALILFLAVLRSLRLLRAWHLVADFGRVLSAASRTLLGCLVVFLLFLMTLAHPGYLLFSRLHAGFASFTDSFYLACNFFRLRHVARFQGAIFDTSPLLCCVYFALFIFGFVVILRGMSAAVLVSFMRHAAWRRRHSSVAQRLLRGLCSCWNYLKNRRKVARCERKLKERKKEIIPVEYAIDEIEIQIEEMLIRTIELADEPDDTATSVVASYLSSSSSLGTDGEVEYLYRREPELYYSSFEVSGYETDQSASSEASDTEARASSPGTPDLNRLAREDPCEPAMMYNPWAAVLSQARAHSPSWAHAPAVEEAEGTSRVFVTPRADSPYRWGIAGRPTSSSSSHSDGFPEHSVISRKSAVSPRSAVSGHGVHTFSRNWDGTPSSPQPWSYARYEANRRLNQARNTRPGNEMGSLLRQGTGSSLSNSPPGPSWQAWGSLPSAAERGLPGASSPVLPPVRTPLSNLSVNRRSWRKS